MNNIINELERQLRELEEEWNEKYPGEGWKKHETDYASTPWWPREKGQHRHQMRDLENRILEETKKYFREVYDREEGAV